MTNREKGFGGDHWRSGEEAPECLGTGVHVWKLALSKSRQEYSAAHLSGDERQRAERFCFDADRKKFVLTRSVLRKLLGRYTGVAADELIFSYNRYGKPYLCPSERHEALFFNITHSRDIALFAFSRFCELGIDIEYRRDEVSCLDLARRFFSEDEYQVLSQFSGDALRQRFYRCWTRKEAFIKAVGRGFSFSLKSFAVNFEEDANPKLLWADSSSFQGSCTMFSIPHDKHYFAALACLGAPEQIACYRWG